MEPNLFFHSHLGHPFLSPPPLPPTFPPVFSIYRWCSEQKHDGALLFQALTHPLPSSTWNTCTLRANDPVHMLSWLSQAASCIFYYLYHHVHITLYMHIGNVNCKTVNIALFSDYVLMYPCGPLYLPLVRSRTTLYSSCPFLLWSTGLKHNRCVIIVHWAKNWVLPWQPFFQYTQPLYTLSSYQYIVRSYILSQNHGEL